MPQAAAPRYTADEVRAMQVDGHHWPRYELVDGELLVTLAPRVAHQVVVTELLLQLGAYLTPLGRRGSLFASPSGISWGPTSLVQPDVFVVTPEEITRRWETVRTLPLAVEVISPSSVHADRVRKRTLYRENDVQTYWIVDIDARVVEVWTPGDDRPLIVDDVLRWRVTPDAPEMVLTLGTLFANVPNE